MQITSETAITGISGMSENAEGPNTESLVSASPDKSSIGMEAAFIAAWAREATQIECVFSYSQSIKIPNTIREIQIITGPSTGYPK